MKRKWNASFTVEAAFIVPLTVGLLFLMVSAALYLRDVTVAKAILTKAANQGAAFLNYNVYPETDYVLYERMLDEDFFQRLLRDDDSEAEQILAMYLQQKFAGAFLFGEPEEIAVCIDGGALRMSCVLNGEKGLWGLESFGIGAFFCQEIEASVPCTDTAEWSRIVTTVLRTGEWIKGIQAVKETLLQFFTWLGK